MGLSNDDREQLEFLLSRYLDGDLDQAARAELQRRLDTDPALAASFEALQGTDRLIRAWAGPVPEVDSQRFVEEAARRRRADDARRRRRRILRVYAPLSAAAMILLAVTLHLAIRSAQLEAGGKTVAMVSIHRADAWRKTPGLGEALAQVRFDRSSPPPGNAVPSSGPRSVAAVAAAGAGPGVAQTINEDATPFF